MAGGYFGPIAGLVQTARVQRGPSEAARCASNGAALLSALPLSTSQWKCDWRGRWSCSERAHCIGEVFALPEASRPALQVASAVRSCGSQQVQTPRSSRGEPAGAVLVSVKSQAPPSPPHTGHFSSFQAISQNIHSYFELRRNDCSIRFFSSWPAVLAQLSILARIHSWTASNSGDA